VPDGTLLLAFPGGAGEHEQRPGASAAPSHRMSQLSAINDETAARLKEHRAVVEAIRQRGRTLFDGGATAIQVAAAISEGTERFVTRIFEETVERVAGRHAPLVSRNLAIAAVGGTGRGELCPYSDVDLLFLIRPAARELGRECVARSVRDYWDAGLKLGHAVRSVSDTLSLAREEIDVATSLIETRRLWGAPDLVDELMARFQKKVVRGRASTFIDDCITARERERSENGSAVKQLEPDVKRSPGGLRELHLLRWVGYSRFAATEVDLLRLQGALSRDEARTLLTAYEFLERVRIDLHFAAGRCQDVLTRDEQLRIAETRGIEGTFAQRPVERFMQSYFRHSTSIAELSERFITLHRPRSLFGALVRSLATHRSEGMYLVGSGRIDVLQRKREQVLSRLEGILKFYRAAALYRVTPDAEFAERIREAAPRLEGELSAESAALFLEILDCSGNLGAILRSMFRTGILEIVVPPMAHARCLLQFNQYHSYTVDEHTLRTVEELERFEHDAGPLGDAYRAVRRKHILHLAMLLHDLGKGYEEDHSDVGRGIAESMAARLRMPDDERDLLVFLVHKHLLMAHQAFRRDNSEPETILDFSREVGSAPALRMLYVLSAADVMGVGPGVWTQWKAELLAELYHRTLLLLSGEDAADDHQRRLARIKEEVVRIDPALLEPAEADSARIAVDSAAAALALERFPSHYLTSTTPERIVADLRSMREYAQRGTIVHGRFDPETATVEYRIITHERDVAGCFHKATGVLTAKRLEIVSAQISTTSDGFVVDSFRVHDRDFVGRVPGDRIDDVASAMTRTLSGQVRVEELFQRHRRFDARSGARPLSDLPARVTIDNSSTERFTVIDVFCHDWPGLLYTIARKVYELELSVVLAKISTHLDQVVDVFYVTDRGGRKIVDPARLKDIQATLLATLIEFEHHERMQFAS
jgi:[protein-PII] uridylyltransferase